MIAVINVTDNTEVIREMTDEEYASLLANQASIAASLTKEQLE